MGCFIGPATEAVVTTIATKVVKSKEENKSSCGRISISTKLKWLSKLLWGGSALLCFEHLWHGEVVPFFPFLTAATSPEATYTMLKELATVGGSMMLLITAVWLVMIAVADNIVKRSSDSKAVKEKN